MKKILFLSVISLTFVNLSYAGQLLFEETINYYNEGVQCQRNGNFDEANTAYKKALLLDSNLNRKFILNNVGIMYAQKGDLKKAKDSFSEALQIDPNYREAQLNLGLTYDKSQDKLRALEYWAKILKLNELKPETFVTNIQDQDKINSGDYNFQKSVFNNMGIIYAQRDDFKKAEEAFNEALKIDPSYNDVQLNLGLIYDKQEDNFKALGYWVKILSLDKLKPKGFIIEDQKK